VPGYLRATVIGDPKFVIELRREVVARGPYGLSRRVRVVGIAPDEPARFEAALRAALAARAEG